jgi:DHA1 family tetracycline resistance protein-like MFS transporter
VFVVVTLTLDAIGIGLILPVLPDLILSVQASGLGHAALWGGLMASGYAVMQFLCGPLIGNLSDRWGRRPVLLASLAAMALHYLAMAVSGSAWVLLAARLAGGVTSATHATAAALLADLSPDDRKSQNFGLMGAAFGIGFVLGPLAGGLLSQIGPRAPFVAAGLLAALNLLLGALVLPETVTDRTRRAFDIRRANPFAAFRHIGDLPGVGRLLLLFFLYEFAFFVYPAIWAFFTQARFDWTAATTGLSLAAFGVMMAVVQGGLIRWALPRFGERGLILYGFCFNTCAFLALALVTSGRLGMALIPLTALGAVVTPALQGQMSRLAGPRRQGELQGVVSAARALAMIVSPLVMTQIFYAYTVPPGVYFPGAAFLLSSALMVVCLAIFLLRPRRVLA